MKAAEPDEENRPLELAQRTMSATTTEEFAMAFSEANLILNRQDWNRYLAECRRLQNEANQRQESPP